MATRPLRFKIFRDRKKQWRWQLLAPNGRVIADCAEGYRTRGAAEKMVAKVQGFAHAAKVETAE